MCDLRADLLGIQVAHVVLGWIPCPCVESDTDIHLLLGSSRCEADAARNLTHTYSLLVAALIMKTIFALGVASSVVVGCLAWSEYALRIIADYISPACQLQT